MQSRVLSFVRRRSAVLSAGAAALTLALAIVGAGCGGKGTRDTSARRADPNPIPEGAALSTAPEVGVPGGRFIVSEIAAPKTFNYIISNEQSSTDVDTQLFDGLTTFNNATQLIEPALAYRWELSADSLSWTFHLRKGIRFSDGVPITSADFRFMYDVMRDSTINTPARESFIIGGKWVTLDAPDDSTLVFHTPVPYGTFADLIVGNLYCMPKHVLERAFKAGKFASAYGVETPPESLVTSGAFMLEQYVPNEKVVLKPNPYYYVVDKKGQRLPYLDQLVYVIVSNQDTELLKFQGGETDVIELPRPEDYKTLKQDAAAKNYTVYDCGPSLRTNFIWFNLNKKSNGAPLVEPYKYAWFNNRDFRYAVAYAIDRDAMSKAVFFGRAVENWGPSTKGNKIWHDPTVPKYSYNPEKSKQLLAGAGFRDTNGDGYLEDAQGHTLEFTLLTNAENNVRVQLATMLQDDLKKVGIKVTPSPMNFNELVAHIQSDLQYECVLLGLASGVPPDPALSSNVYKSTGMTHFWYINQPSPGTPWEAQMDKLMDDMTVSFNLADRKRMWNEVQHLVTSQNVFIYLPTQEAYTVVRNRFGNVRAGVIPPPVAWNAREIFVKKGAAGS